MSRATRRIAAAALVVAALGLLALAWGGYRSAAALMLLDAPPTCG